MEGELSNPTRLGKGGRAREAPGGGGRWQRWTPFRKQSLRHLPSAEKTRSTHATSRAGPGAAGLAGARGGRGSEAGAEPLALRAATSPAGLPRRSRRPHARTSPTSRGRLPWRLAASPEAALNGCRSQSTTPRRGTSSPPAAPGSPAAPPLSREAGRESAEGGGGGRAGLPTAAATSAPHPEGRPPLCFVADFSARSPGPEHSEEGGGGVAAASATLPAECQVEEGKERRRRRRWWGRGAPECGPPPPTSGPWGQGGQLVRVPRGPAAARGAGRR